MNVSGLTNRTTCPGCGEAVTLPHVFPEAYPWSRTSFVLKFFSSSGEWFASPDRHRTYGTLIRKDSSYFTTGCFSTIVPWPVEMGMFTSFGLSVSCGR
jgi:hypothetical protein